jgi:hypothetical protein
VSTLAADKPRVFETGHDEFINELPAIASDTIYEGAAVGELNDTGTYQPLGTGSTVDRFAGFCTEKCDNSAGAAGAKKVKVKQRGRVKLAVTGVTAITDVGKTVWATDDDTFTVTYAAGAVEVGEIVRYVGTADGGASTTCIVDFRAFSLRQDIDFTFFDETVSLATDRAIFLATRPYDVRAITEIHSVAAGGSSTLQVTKDVTTDAPGAGTDMLSDNTNTGFDLNATANTVQTGTLKTTAGLRKLNAGDRLSIDFANAIQSTTGLKIGLRLRPL